MYNLHLSAEQLEIRDTVREFVTRQVKPIVLKADRLDACDRRLPMALLDKASQLGLRTLTLAEDQGGAGADQLTCAIVTEELSSASVAAVMSTPSSAPARATIPASPVDSVATTSSIVCVIARNCSAM